MHHRLRVLITLNGLPPSLILSLRVVEGVKPYPEFISEIRRITRGVIFHLEMRHGGRQAVGGEGLRNAYIFRTCAFLIM